MTKRVSACRGAWLWTGTITFGDPIPPNSRAFASGRCTLHLKPGCDNVTVLAQFPHAHYLGRKVWLEHYSANATGRLSATPVRAVRLPTCSCAALRAACSAARPHH